MYVLTFRLETYLSLQRLRADCAELIHDNFTTVERET